MKIFVLVKANVKNNEVKKIDGVHFEVRLKEPAQDGRANAALVKAIAKYFDIPKSKVVLLRGLKSKQKVLQVDI